MDRLQHLLLNVLLVVFDLTKGNKTTVLKTSWVKLDHSRIEKKSRRPHIIPGMWCEAQLSVLLLSVMTPDKVWPEIAQFPSPVISMLMQQYLPLSNFRRWYSSTCSSGAKLAICNHTAQRRAFSHGLFTQSCGVELCVHASSLKSRIFFKP